MAMHFHKKGLRKFRLIQWFLNGFNERCQRIIELDDEGECLNDVYGGFFEHRGKYLFD